jgi:hypothetical protein
MASPDANPKPAVAFLVFFPVAIAVGIIGWALNWFLSVAAMFAVLEGEDVVGALSTAAGFIRERTGAVLAVSLWTGLAHLVVLSAASTAVAFPLGVANVLPWRLVVLAVLIIVLGYFAVADWLYTARLAGYVCIVEKPEDLPVPQIPPTVTPPTTTTIDRDELILSDVPTVALGEA